MISQQYRIMFFHRFHNSLGKRRRTGTVVRNNRNLFTYMTRDLRSYIEVRWFIFHTRNSRSIFRLKMQNDIYIRTLTKNPQMKGTFHGRFHTVLRRTRSNITNGYFLFLQIRHPRTCSGNKRFFTDSP